MTPEQIKQLHTLISESVPGEGWQRTSYADSVPAWIQVNVTDQFMVIADWYGTVTVIGSLNNTPLNGTRFVFSPDGKTRPGYVMLSSGSDISRNQAINMFTREDAEDILHSLLSQRGNSS